MSPEFDGVTHLLLFCLQVKILGVLAMIDDGELDWKMIAINSEDPLFSELNDISDVETKCPGTVSGEYKNHCHCNANVTQVFM